MGPLLTHRPATEFDGRIRIATIFPTLGRYGLSGVESQRGTLLASVEINAAGGVHKRALWVVEYGIGSYFVDARHAAELAIGEGGALAVVGSNSSGLSQAIAGVCEAAGVPQVSNVSTAQSLTWDPQTGVDRRFVFRMCAPDVVLGQRLAHFALDELGARRAAALYEVSRAYSSLLATTFLDEFARHAGGRAVADFLYLPLETDFRPSLRRAAAFQPDVLFVPASFTDATLVAMQAEKLGIHTTLLGGDGWSNRLLFSVGGPARPAYYVDLCTVPAVFSARYVKRFGGDPPSCRALLAYDALRAIAAALGKLGPLADADLTTQLGKTRGRLRDTLASLDVPGAAGPIRFDAHGDALRGVAIVRVEPSGAGYRSSLVHEVAP